MIKCLIGEFKRFLGLSVSYYELDSQPSLHLVVRKKVDVAMMGTAKNCPALPHFLLGPLAALLCTTPAPVLHTSGGTD